MIETLLVGGLFATVAYAITKQAASLKISASFVAEHVERREEAQKQSAQLKEEELLLNLEILLTEAEELTRAKKYDQGLTLLDRALRLSPDSARVQVDRAETFLEQQKYGSAIEAANAAIELDPLNDVAYNVVGMSEYALKQYENAAKAFEHSVVIDETKPTRFANLALAFGQMKQTKKELTALKRAVELDPGNLEYLKLLVNAAIKEDDTPAAMSALEAMLTIAPTNPWSKRELVRLKRKS